MQEQNKDLEILRHVLSMLLTAKNSLNTINSQNNSIIKVKRQTDSSIQEIQREINKLC